LFPRLSFRGTMANTNMLTISWPSSWGGSGWVQNDWLNWGGYTLWQSPLTNPAIWSAASGSISNLSGTNQFIAPAATSGRMYLLRSP